MVRRIGNLERMSTTKNAFLTCNIVRVDHMYGFRLLSTVYFSSAVVVNFVKFLACLDHKRTDARTGNTDVWTVPHFRTNYKLQSLRHLPVTFNTSLPKKQFTSFFVIL